MYFEVVGDVSQQETFATGREIRELPRLVRMYGRGRWRKRKGIATVRLERGIIRRLRFIGTRKPAWAGKS